MRIRYSQEADALYIRLKETKIEDTDEVSEDLVIDYDTDGSVVGIEVLAHRKSRIWSRPKAGTRAPANSRTFTLNNSKNREISQNTEKKPGF